MTTSSWIRKPFARLAPRTTRKAPRRGRLGLEALEDRCCLSTFTVTNTLDNGSLGSLRWAVGQANANVGADTIDFDSSVSRIVLGGGQLELTDTIGATTITGPAAGVTVSGNNLSRVFQVDAGVTALFSGLTISDGSADDGGGVWSAGTLSMTGCTISGNTAARGGGLYNGGTATLIDCSIGGNTAIHRSSLDDGSGGGVWNNSNITLMHCTISDNHAISNISHVNQNEHPDLGGYVGGAGGGLMNVGMHDNVDFRGTIQPQILATLIDCTIDGNTATGDGGGLCNQAILIVNDCTISGNSAGYGGGVSVITDAAYSEGHIRLAFIRAVLTNCTITGNEAHPFPNAAGGTGGAGARNLLTNLALVNCTLTANITYVHTQVVDFNIENNLESSTLNFLAAGVTDNDDDWGGTLLVNTIVTWRRDDDSIRSQWSPNYLFSYFGFNVINTNYGDKTFTINCFHPSTDQFYTAGPLGDYGGPTLTIPLLPAAPPATSAPTPDVAADQGTTVADNNFRTIFKSGARDAYGLIAGVGIGPPVIPTTDQRGFARVGAPDIGATEVHAIFPAGVRAPNYVVNTTSDSLVPAPDYAGPAPYMSLPLAIQLANLDGVASTITFDPQVFATSQTIARTDPMHVVPSSVGSSFLYTVVALTTNGEAPSPEVGAANNTVSLRWNPLPGAVLYRVYRRPNTSGSAYESLGTVDAQTLTFTDTGASTASGVYHAWLELGDRFAPDAIIGPAAGVTIEGSGLGQVLQIDAGAAASVSGLTITGGNSLGAVGTVTVNQNAALTMNDCTIRNNSGSTGGVAGFRVFGTATLTDCTISDNTSSTAAGGLVAVAGSRVTMINCTVSRNTGGNSAVVVQAGSSVALINCTISGNIATTATAGGVRNNGGTITLSNTIVAGNTGTVPDVSGAFGSQGHNLIGKTDGSSGWVSSDLTGTIASPLNPLLGPLDNYGGPTQTMALLPGSPALNAGTATGAPSTDQRGRSRLGNVDIGAFEVSLSQTITFGPLAGMTYGAADFAIGATATSGLPVTFTASGNASVRQVAGVWYVHILAAGGATITAHQAGNAAYDSAPDVARALSIAKADATIVVTAYTGATTTYDGKAHTAGGAATGVNGEDLSARLNLSGTTHTDAGTHNGDAWSFAGDTNYNNANGTVDDSIAKADATVTVSGYTGVYDAAYHGATGSASGLGGADLSSGLNLGASFTYPPGGTAHWTFAGGTNYNDQSGDVAIVIKSNLALAPIATPDSYVRSFTYALQAVPTGGIGALTYSLTGTPDASIDPQTGAITVTPTDAGTLTFQVQVADEHAGIATRDVSLVVKAFDVVGGVLMVGGNGSDNKIQLLNHGPTQPVLIYVDNFRIDRNNIIGGAVTGIQVSGGDGNDSISVEPNLGQPETIWGGAGADSIIAGGGPVTIYGGAGNDVIGAGSSAGALILGGAGNDSIGGSPQNDLIFGEGGNDTVQGNNGDDAIVGGEGSDLLGGGSGRDLVIGGNGADALVGNGGEDILVAGSTDYDAPTAANMGALTAIRQFWSGDDPSAADFRKRVSALSTGSKGYAGPLLNASTVHDDGAIDALYGDNTGTSADIDFDWYILNSQGSGAKDLIKDLTDADELLARLDI